MSNEDSARSGNGESSRSRNWSVTLGRVALLWALFEALMAGLANMSGGSLLGVNGSHFSLDAIITALVGIGFVLDGAALRLADVARVALERRASVPS